MEYEDSSILNGVQLQVIEALAQRRETYCTTKELMQTTGLSHDRVDRSLVWLTGHGFVCVRKNTGWHDAKESRITDNGIELLAQQQEVLAMDPEMRPQRLRFLPARKALICNLYHQQRYDRDFSIVIDAATSSHSTLANRAAAIALLRRRWLTAVTHKPGVRGTPKRVMLRRTALSSAAMVAGFRAPGII